MAGKYPKVKLVRPQSGKLLRVTFDNGVSKTYDCNPLLGQAPFRALEQEWLFRSVQADPGGYGISWNEEIDLSEGELWENGRLTASDSQ